MLMIWEKWQIGMNSKISTLSARPLEEVLEDLRRANEAHVSVLKAHMNMTPAERRAAEEKVAAQQGGSRVYHIEDLVRAHEEGPAGIMPAGYYMADLLEGETGA